MPPTVPQGEPVPRAEYRVRAKVWRYPGKGGWHFANLSRAQSREIRELFGAEAAGFGSLRVVLRLGSVAWKTSIFPDSKSGTYLFAIKADVRRRANVGVGDTISATVGIL